MEECEMKLLTTLMLTLVMTAPAFANRRDRMLDKADQIERKSQRLYRVVNNNLYDNIAFEAKEQMAAFTSQDFKEGVTAFLEKRKAKFTGK